MNFDLEAQILSARLHVRQSVRRNVMLAKTAIHLEAEKVRDDIKCLFDFAEAEQGIVRFRRGFERFTKVWETRK